MTSRKFWSVLAVSSCIALSPMALASTALAQDVPAEIQSMANQLARQGYTEFQLRNTGDAPALLVASQDGAVVELYFHPETLQIVRIMSGIDENGDGVVSQAERHRVSMPDEESDIQRVALETAEQTRLRVHEMVQLETAEQLQTRTQLAEQDRLADGSGSGGAGGGSSTSSGNGSGGSGGGGSGSGGSSGGNGHKGP